MIHTSFTMVGAHLRLVLTADNRTRLVNDM